MLAKFGLILLVLLATALAFVAGTLLPGSDPPDTESPAAASDASAPVADAGGRSPGAGDERAAGDPGQSKQEGPPPIPYADLTLPNVLPEKAELALQIGRFIDADRATPRAREVEALGQKTRLLDVADPNGERWQVLVAGPYASLDQARTQRLALRRGLNLSHPPAILLLPPAKPPAKD